jgi:hypothetical protein
MQTYMHTYMHIIYIYIYIHIYFFSASHKSQQPREFAAPALSFTWK